MFYATLFHLVKVITFAKAKQIFDDNFRIKHSGATQSPKNCG